MSSATDHAISEARGCNQEDSVVFFNETQGNDGGNSLTTLRSLMNMAHYGTTHDELVLQYLQYPNSTNSVHQFLWLSPGYRASGPARWFAENGSENGDVSESLEPRSPREVVVKRRRSARWCPGLLASLVEYGLIMFNIITGLTWVNYICSKTLSDNLFYNIFLYNIVIEC